MKQVKICLLMTFLLSRQIILLFRQIFKNILISYFAISRANNLP